MLKHEKALLECGRRHASAGEDRIVDMPVDAAIRQIRQYQRRLCNERTDNRPIDHLGTPFALAEQDVRRLPVDLDDQYACQSCGSRHFAKHCQDYNNRRNAYSSELGFCLYCAMVREVRGMPSVRLPQLRQRDWHQSLMRRGHSQLDARVDRLPPAWPIYQSW